MTRITKLLWAAGVGVVALAACAPASEPEDRSFDLRIVDGALADSVDLRVNQGDNVSINWTSDAPASLHLHGYDVEIDLSPDQPGEMAFAAEATGGFDITMHARTNVEDGVGSHEPHTHESTETCSEPVPERVSPVLRVETHPSADPMSFDVTVEVEDPPQGSLHWHLYVDGALKTMTAHATTRLDLLDPGTYQVQAVLSSDATHCEYDISDTTTVTAGHADAHSSDVSAHDEVVLTRFIVNP